MSTIEKPLLIYDGDCNFCKKWVERVRKKSEDKLSFAPSQEVADQFPQISSEQFRKSVQFVEPDGNVKSGAEAVFSVLALNSFFFKVVLWKYKYIPGFAAVNEWMYRWVAKHRLSNCKI